MIETDEEKEGEEMVQVELNSFEFFAQALLHFEGEATGKLRSAEQSPANPVGSWNKKTEINAIKTTMIRESNQETSKLLEESTSTHDEPSGLSFGEMVDDDSLETTMINSIALDHNIVGTNSRLTNEYQM